jgi:hypothetical protein
MASQSRLLVDNLNDNELSFDSCLFETEYVPLVSLFLQALRIVGIAAHTAECLAMSVPKAQSSASTMGMASK